jgi:ferredoxin
MARAIVDAALCQGHTLCNFAAPDVFHLNDEDGHAFVAVDGELTAEQLEQARMAELGCPERAITIQE